MTLKKIYLLATITNAIILLAYIITLPAQVPIQVGLDLTVLKLGSKWTLPLIFAVMPVVCSIFFFIERKNETPRTTTQKVIRYIFLLGICLLFCFSWVVAFIAGSNTPVGFKINFPLALTVGVVIGLCLISVSPYIKRCEFGGKIGFKNKWVNDSKIVWEKTHHISSYLVLSAGIICIVSGIIDYFAKTNMIALLIGLILTIILITLPYLVSYIVSKKIGKGEQGLSN